MSPKERLAILLSEKNRLGHLYEYLLSYCDFDRADLTVLESIKEKLAETEKACNRLVDGMYGLCESCGLLISEERLNAVPETRLCIECARNEERVRYSL